MRKVEGVVVSCERCRGIVEGVERVLKLREVPKMEQKSEWV